MATSAACECGAEEQTLDHVVLQSPIHRSTHGLRLSTMRLSNGCSTSAPRSSVAKQWLEELAQKMKKPKGTAEKD